METVKLILTCFVRFRREKYKTVQKTTLWEQSARYETLSKTNHVRLSHVIQHSPTSCAQFDPKRVSAYNRPRSISVYQVRPQQLKSYWWLGIIFPFLLRCFFFFCRETIYRKVAFVFPFLVLKKSSGAFNHSFISIAFELTRSRRFVKEKPRRLSLNRIAKQEP